MAAQPTIMNRMQNMPKPGVVPVENPNFPKFFSTQNAKKFFGDITGGLEPGSQGGTFGGIGGGALADYQAQGKIAQEFLANQPYGPQTQEVAQQAAALQPSLLGSLRGAAQDIIPQAQGVQKFLNQIKPQPNVPEAQLQKYGTKTPQAQSGPQMIAQGPGGEQKPYFSFEKYFTGSPSMRSLILPGTQGAPAEAQASGMPQGPGKEDTNNPVPNTPEQKPMEQWGRPQGTGFWNSAKGYAYDVANWLKESPWSQRIVGGLAGFGATYLSGGLLAPAAPFIGAGAGGLFKGLMGQVTNFLAERTDVPANAENPGKPSAPVQALQQPAILRTA